MMGCASSVCTPAERTRVGSWTGRFLREEWQSNPALMQENPAGWGDSDKQIMEVQRVGVAFWWLHFIQPSHVSSALCCSLLLLDADGIQPDPCWLISETPHPGTLWQKCRWMPSLLWLPWQKVRWVVQWWSGDLDITRLPVSAVFRQCWVRCSTLLPPSTLTIHTQRSLIGN